MPPIAPSAVDSPTVSPPVPKPPAVSPSRPEPPPAIEPPPESKPSFLERRRERKSEDEAARARVESTPEPAPATAPPSDTSEAERKPLLDRLRRPKEEEAEKTAGFERPDVKPEPEAPAARKPSLLERRREKREARVAEGAAVPSPPPATLREPPAIDVSPEQLAQRPAAATSKPVTAEELRGARPAIGGRLRWSDEETRVIDRPDDDVSRREISKVVRPVDQEREGLGGRWIAIFVLHLLLAMVAGAVLVGATAAIASLVSSGNVALLEIRGLPIFIGGATAVMLFTLLRTGRRAPEAERRGVIVSVVVGFIILVAAATLLLQPRVIENVQGDLERALGVYGPDETEAVNDFIADINSWNTETTNYRDDVVRPLLRGQSNIDVFRFEAAGTEETLKGTVNSMRAHAGAADNERLRDALGDLAAVYEERLSAILLITRGLVNNDQALVNSGETRRDASKVRAVDFFDQRLKPLLERAEIDPDSFAVAVAEGY
jgi:hypothetical protein